MKTITTEEYLQTPRPKLQWLVEELVPDPSMILIEGPPKEGKSFLAFDLARCIAQGQPFLGRKTRQATSLYLQFDSSTSELVWRERLEKFVSYGISLSGPLYTIHPDEIRVPINILKPEDKLWIKSLVEECNPTLTVIDVLREIHNADENDSTQMKVVGDILLTIFKGRTLVLVHHSKKIGQDNTNPNPSDVARGSSYISGKVDSMWLLWNHYLKIHSRFAEVSKCKLVQNSVGMWGLSPLTGTGDINSKVLKLCNDFPKISHNALAPLAEQQLGLSRSKYYSILEGLTCPHTDQGLSQVGTNTADN